MFQANEAGWDGIVRIILGLAMLVLGWGGFVGGTLGVVLQWLGFIPLITGLIGWCPLYAVFHFKTKAV
jgi:hypothetical protein